MTVTEIRASSKDDRPVLSVVGISKRYGPVAALSGCDFEVLPGEVHGLVGANGAGKSTLVRVISGATKPDAGRVRISEWEGAGLDPRHAQELGVATIYQDPDLVPTLGVAENIALGREPRRYGVFVNRRAERKAARDVASRIGIDAPDFGRKTGNLSRGEQQLAEIAKALHRDVKVLLMDEPTAPLGPDSVELLARVIRDLARGGVGIVYISHRLREVLAVCDRITVMRDGRVVWTRDREATTEQMIVDAMSGRRVAEARQEERHIGEEMLRVDGLTQSPRLHDISFQVHAGEIVGLGGLVGAGRSRLLRALVGAERTDAGHVSLRDTPYSPSSPAQALKAGVGLVPEDRKRDGLFLDLSIKANVNFTRPVSGPLGIIRMRDESEVAKTAVAEFGIVPPRINARVRTLSGGNQQKTLLARWLRADLQVLLVDEPGAGVDIHGKAEIARILRAAASQGIAVVVSCSEMDELLDLADRIVVMRSGRVAGELARADATEDAILSLASREEA
ncbi:MAG: sugar ABC transporter ATP-binding protein [Dehalococcoidia bacterium]